MLVQCGVGQNMSNTLILNSTCRAITGCLQPTQINKIYCLSRIAPPEIRRSVATDLERTKQLKDERHPMFKYEAQRTRLKSRHSFIHSATELKDPPHQARLQRWKDETKLDDPIQPTQKPGLVFF